MKRSAPMKRTGFKPKGWTPRPAKQMDDYTPKPRATAVARHDGKARMVVQVPKPEPCKPGKRAPTAEEREWLDFITGYGCIACRMDNWSITPPAVHHILRGGRRIGHLFTLPLCDPGHHQNGQAKGMVSRHPWKAQFEARYGSEMTLLGLLQAQYQKQRKAA